MSCGVKEYYATHDGPWKSVKRDKKFKKQISKSLKRAY